MTHTKKKARWSFSTGEHGKNRVRAFEHQTTGLLFLEFGTPSRPGIPILGRARPKVKRVALGHRDRERAKATAEEAAAKLRRAEPPTPEDVTLATLFDNYLVEVTPQKGKTTQLHDRSCAEMFQRAFGGDTPARALTRREWDRFIRDRRTGVIRPAGRTRRTVGDRVIAYDLQFLRAVLNWATMASDGRGGVLLERNPLKGLPLPREQNPRRGILTEEEYQAMRGVARSVSPAFEVALVLAHETGHRVNSIRNLRWSDVTLSGQPSIRWRAEDDKIGMEHRTPITQELAGILTRERSAACAIGDALIFPSPTDASQPISRYVFIDWWKAAEKRAGVKHEPRRAWHSLRRKFATELKGIPLKDLCQLGGWKEPTTIIQCYQHPDEQTMRRALDQRQPLKAAGPK